MLLLYMQRYQQHQPPVSKSHRIISPHHGNAPADCADLKIDASASTALGRVSLPPVHACTTRTSHGYPIPDPGCTPGAINPTLTTDILRDGDFRTSCIRGQDTTQHEKFETYEWYGIEHPSHNTGENQTCELDHLVSLELGGADTLDNIWPQCGPADTELRERYFKEKDLVENYLAHQVKDGSMDLASAQKGIASDWTQYLEEAREYCRGERCR